MRNSYLLEHQSLSGRTLKWLRDIAFRIDAQNEAILLAWREAVANDERLAATSRLSKVEFEDNVTASLQLLCQQLRKGTGFSQEGSADDNKDADWADREESKHAHEHGFHRWQEGYNIRELVLEWGHLHLCMIQVINQYEREHLQVDREAIYLSRTAVGQLMNAGISQSVIEYHRLQQAEAGEIVQGLAESLEQLSGWEQQRGQVLREAVHDLRGNLWAVQAATDVLNIVTRPDADNSRQDEIINVLQRGTLTLHRMLTDLLDLARLEAGQEVRKIRQLDVASMLRELCETHEAIAQSKELYLVSDGPETLIVEGDAILLQRIAQNLMLNAIKYTFTGGVSVRWCQKDPHTWSLIVEDTGPGILTSEKSLVLHELINHETPEKDKATQIPEQSQVTTGGEGVGIAIVKRLCELLEAKLEVATSQDQGTCFQITFPTNYSASN